MWAAPITDMSKLLFVDLPPLQIDSFNLHSHCRPSNPCGSQRDHFIFHFHLPPLPHLIILLFHPLVRRSTSALRYSTTTQLDQIFRFFEIVASSFLSFSTTISIYKLDQSLKAPHVEVYLSSWYLHMKQRQECREVIYGKQIKNNCCRLHK